MGPGPDLLPDRSQLVEAQTPLTSSREEVCSPPFLFVLLAVTPSLEARPGPRGVFHLRPH